ncbi:SDR family NAD(P)-dependent oxidoreductase, partial [Streptococcus suis]
SERIAIVTGAGGGIGLAIAEQFADMGLRTVLVGRSASVVEAARSIQEYKKTQSEGFIVDLGNEAAITGFLEVVKTRYGRGDILVNNAGIHPK